jgi:hypothetical protein
MEQPSERSIGQVAREWGVRASLALVAVAVLCSIWPYTIGLVVVTTLALAGAVAFIALLSMVPFMVVSDEINRRKERQQAERERQEWQQR